jgi:hypothetical protein
MVPEIVVLLLTKGRVNYTLRVIHTLEANLGYENYSYYVADGGSEKSDLYPVLDLITDYGAGLKYHNQELTAGQNWNKGIKAIYNSGVNIYLRMENDFELTEKLDITPYAELLNNLSNVGCIRLGLLPINLDIQTCGYKGRIYQDIMKMRQYTWSGNPCLVHRRFHEAYNFFSEKPLSPGDTELSIDANVRRYKGPAIWRPNELGDYGPFSHIGTDQSIF